MLPTMAHLADDEMLVVLLVHGQQSREEPGNLLLQFVTGHEVAHGAHGLGHRQPELEHTEVKQRTSVRPAATTRGQTEDIGQARLVHGQIKKKTLKMIFRSRIGTHKQDCMHNSQQMR